MEPCRGDDVRRKCDPHKIILACHTRSKWTNTVKLRGNIFTRKMGNFDWMDADMDSTFCLEKSLANVTTPNGREDLHSAIFAHQHYSFPLHE